jgi:mannose-6-phosphate isomerase class I
VDADLPDGNIVYEVQVDVMDDYCTIRSFDQANIKNDGSVRPLAIDDYFQALDLDPTMNDPAHFLQHAAVETDGNAQLKTLFNNQFYVTELVEFDGVYTGKATQTQESFHHLYPLVESIKVVSGTESWFVPAGWSFFIPASLQQYQIESTGTHGKVLITHL